MTFKGEHKTLSLSLITWNNSYLSQLLSSYTWPFSLQIFLDTTLSSPTGFGPMMKLTPVPLVPSSVFTLPKTERFLFPHRLWSHPGRNTTCTSIIITSGMNTTSMADMEISPSLALGLHSWTRVRMFLQSRHTAAMDLSYFPPQVSFHLSLWRSMTGRSVASLWHRVGCNDSTLWRRRASLGPRQGSGCIWWQTVG